MRGTRNGLAVGCFTGRTRCWDIAEVRVLVQAKTLALAQARAVLMAAANNRPNQLHHSDRGRHSEWGFSAPASKPDFFSGVFSCHHHSPRVGECPQSPFLSLPCCETSPMELCHVNQPGVCQRCVPLVRATRAFRQITTRGFPRTSKGGRPLLERTNVA
jgi:hypothetical protein